jgi:FAD/FMN-containing dehydrogenase
MAIATISALTYDRSLMVERLNTLRASLRGQLVTPEDPAFDQVRKVVNFTVDRRPLAIVRAADAHDVAAAVVFAREHDLPLSVRSGGHSLAKLNVIDDAILVDLSTMKRITIDPATRTARVQPGVTSGDFADPANSYGLALTTGDTHSVGFGGLTTGGGIGYMVRKYGLTIDSMLSAQVVTAAGDIVTANHEEHPDLFWAIRGGGGNAGIVTEFTFRLAPVGQILGGEILLPATREVLRGYLDYVTDAPDDLTTIAALLHAPPAPHVPEDRVGQLVLSILVCWTGDMAEGERVLAPLRALATPITDVIQPMPYPAIYQFTAHYAEPHGSAIRMMFADDLSDDSLDASIAAMQNASSPFSLIQFRGLGGAMARVPDAATAFAHRQRRYFVAIIAVWLDPAEDASHHNTWTANLWETIRHEGQGVYVNFLEREGRERVREAYPPATYARLAEIKRRYDPTNLFQFNQNIPPQH